MSDAGRLRIAGQHGSYTTGAVWLLPGGLKEVRGPALAHRLHMQRQRLLERRREGHDSVLAPVALGDADPAGVEIDVVEADGDKLGDADAGIEQGLDEHHVAAPTLLPHRLVVAADLGLGRHIGKALGLPLDLHVQLGAEVTEDPLQVDVIGSLASKLLGELAGLLPGRRALCWRSGRARERAGVRGTRVARASDEVPQLKSLGGPRRIAQQVLAPITEA